MQVFRNVAETRREAPTGLGATGLDVRWEIHPRGTCSHLCACAQLSCDAGGAGGPWAGGGGLLTNSKQFPEPFMRHRIFHNDPAKESLVSLLFQQGRDRGYALIQGNTLLNPMHMKWLI